MDCVTARGNCYVTLVTIFSTRIPALLYSSLLWMLFSFSLIHISTGSYLDFEFGWDKVFGCRVKQDTRMMARERQNAYYNRTDSHTLDIDTNLLDIAFIIDN